MQTLADRLNRQLDTWLADRPGHVVAVLDVASESALSQLTNEGACLDLPVAHLRLQRLQLPPDLLPALVPLSPANWRLRQQTVHVAMNVPAEQGCPSVCGWVWSELQPSELARRLDASMFRAHPAGGSYYFRHHDPRVRACLSELLGADWLAQCLPVTHEWLSATPPSLLHTGRGVAAPGHPPSQTTPQRAQQAIERCEEINRALQAATAAGWTVHDRAHVDADAALSRCEAHGFGGAADRLAYAMHALTVSPSFDRHPAIDAALRSAVKNHESYLQAAADIPADVWQAAGSTLSAPRASREPNQ